MFTPCAAMMGNHLPLFVGEKVEQSPPQYQQKTCFHPNCIADFQMDIAKPHVQTVKIVNGPAASQQLGISDRRYIEQEILKRWENASPQLLEEIPSEYCNFWVCIFRTLTVCVIGLICLLPYVYFRNLQARKDSNRWREEFIREMQDFIHTDLKIKYPDFTFTLIYPVVIYQTLITVTTQNGTPINQTQQPVISQIYTYIRVSNAQLPIGDSYEPTIDSTYKTTTMLTVDDYQNSIGGAPSHSKPSDPLIGTQQYT
eukprot:554258_1